MQLLVPAMIVRSIQREVACPLVIIDAVPDAINMQIHATGSLYSMIHAYPYSVLYYSLL